MIMLAFYSWGIINAGYWTTQCDWKWWSVGEAAVLLKDLYLVFPGLHLCIYFPYHKPEYSHLGWGSNAYLKYVQVKVPFEYWLRSWGIYFLCRWSVEVGRLQRKILWRIYLTRFVAVVCTAKQNSPQCNRWKLSQNLPSLECKGLE